MAIEALRAESPPEPARIPMSMPIGRDGMGYRWEVADLGIVFRIDYLSTRNAEITGEIEITINRRHLHQARLNITSTSSRTGLAQALGNRAKAISKDSWDEYLERFCAAVLRAERVGSPLVRVGTQPIQPTRYLMEELIQEGKPNLLFGPGGGGKGYLTTAICVCVLARRGLGRLTVREAVPVYFDWEDDEVTMNERVQRVAHGMGIEPPELAYKRMKGLATDRINEMARAVQDAGATFGIIDSVSAASGTPGRGETWDGVAHRLFDGLDLIPSGRPGVPMTWLLIGHVTGEGVKEAIAGKMFGSIQYMNRARCAWELRSQQEDGSGTVEMTLYHAKWNHTGRKRPIPITMEFEGDGVTFETGTAVKSNGKLTLAGRMEEYLAEFGAATVKTLAFALKTSEGTIRAEFSRHGARFRAGSQGFWDLVHDDDPEDTGGDLPF